MSLYDDFDGCFERVHPFGIPGDVWKSKNGPIKVSDMSEQHIAHCMEVVGEDDAWYGRFLKELKRRKETQT